MERKTFLKSLAAIAALKVLPIEELSLPARSPIMPIATDLPGIGSHTFRLLLNKSWFNHGDVVILDSTRKEYVYEFVGDSYKLIPIGHNDPIIEIVEKGSIDVKELEVRKIRSVLFEE